ncbi:MAG: DUF726 domain-containing protein [Candidatus Bipolaricaulia bacterium]
MPVNLTVGWVGLVAFCLLATPAATAQSADELPGNADTPIVSTRGHFDPETRKLKEGIGPTSYQVLGHVPGLMGGRCPPRLITFVHGYDKGETSAIESFDIAEASFSDPVVGFSWDSETGFWLSPFNFWDATQIADRNGQKLARFLVDYADQCPKTGLHLVGHSLGARIVLRTVEVFYQRGGPKVETVQLIGAAVEDDIFAKLDLIEPVETKVDRIVNYFNRRDGTLRWALFGLFDMPLGQQGIDGTMPANYREVDVTCCVGTNHRTPFYLDVAAKLMNDVIQGDWNDASTEIRNAPRVLGKARTGTAAR